MCLSPYRYGAQVSCPSNLCSDFGGDIEAAQAVQEWKASYLALRNRVPRVPPNYADEAFGVYKKCVLHDSYYFSITELLLDASLRKAALVTAVFNGDSFEYRGKSSFAGPSNPLMFFLLER